jgi:hypothetical protein
VLPDKSKLQASRGNDCIKETVVSKKLIYNPHC